MRRRCRRFPDRSFGGLAVAEQHVGPVVGADPPGVQRDADRRADALAERAGGDVHERQARRRMPFEIRLDRPELQQLVAREQPGFGPGGIENRRGVPFDKHEPIVVGVLRVCGS